MFIPKTTLLRWFTIDVPFCKVFPHVRQRKDRPFFKRHLVLSQGSVTRYRHLRLYAIFGISFGDRAAAQRMTQGGYRVPERESNATTTLS